SFLPRRKSCYQPVSCFATKGIELLACFFFYEENRVITFYFSREENCVISLFLFYEENRVICLFLFLRRKSCYLPVSFPVMEIVLLAFFFATKKIIYQPVSCFAT